MIASLSMLISLVFIITLHSMKMKYKRDELIFDLLTVTINDYTVEFKISEIQTYNFAKDHYNE